MSVVEYRFGAIIGSGEASASALTGSLLSTA
jgi:hypothetical protein